jgi:hypothetical protein
MGLRSGMNAQIGFKTESSWAVPVVVDSFNPLVSESMGAVPEEVKSNAIIAGRRVLTSDQVSQGRMRVGGSIGLELTNKSQALLWEHIFGDASSPYTPGDLTSKSFTMQIGKPDASGTTQPCTYAGCKITEAQMGFAVGELATLGADVIAKREILVRVVADGVTNTDTSLTSATAVFTDDDKGKPVSGTGIAAGTTILSVTSATVVVLSLATTATATGVSITIGIALAAASYVSGLKPISFTKGSVSIAGSAVKVKKGTLSMKNGLDVERFFVGDPAIDEQLEADLRDYTLELDLEYTDNTQYKRYLNGTEHAVVLTFSFVGYSLVITTNVRFTGKAPEVGNKGIVPQMLSMMCVGPTTDASAISVALTEQA